MLHYSYHAFYFIVASCTQKSFHPSKSKPKIWFEHPLDAVMSFAIFSNGANIIKNASNGGKGYMNQIGDIWVRIIVVEIATAWCNGPSSISCLFPPVWEIARCAGVCKYCNAISHHLLGFIVDNRNERIQQRLLVLFLLLMRNFRADSYQSLTHSFQARTECETGVHTFGHA